jgi:hypothetical protein
MRACPHYSSPTSYGTADIASAIAWTQGVRSRAAAAAQACTQQCACDMALSNGECGLSSAAARLVPENGHDSPDFTCTYEQAAAYGSLVDSLHFHFSRHAAVLDPLRMSLKSLSAPAAPAPRHLVHASTQATQAFSHSIALYHSLPLALASRRTGPVSTLSPWPASDPVLQALSGQGALVELVAAQKAATDVAAAAV